MSSEDDIIERLLAADPPENPAGMALCLLTIDLQRVSGHPVDEPLLRRMLPRYLSADDVDGAVFEAGLAWAVRTIPETDVSLLRAASQSESTRVWEAHPALIAADSRRMRRLHSAVVEMLALRATALLKERSEEAAVEYLRAAAQAHPGAAGAAAFIGNAFLQLGGIDTGAAFIMIVVEHGEPELAAAAAGMLAGKLEDAGDLEGAATALRHLVDMNLPEYLPRAAYTLGGWLTRMGRPEEACHYFRLAVDSGDPGYAAKAAGVLGELLLRQGRNAEAAEALRIAGQGDGELSVRAAGLLGDALWKLGDLRGAELSYSKAAASADAELAVKAAYALSGVRIQRGDARGATDALRLVVQSGNPLAGRAGVELGRLLRELGNHEAAADAFTQAIDAIPPDDKTILPDAVLRLAWLLRDHQEEYPRILRDASARGAEYAVVGLSALLERDNDIDAAKQVCELAIASGRSEPAIQGARVMARLMRVYEDIPCAKEALALLRTAQPADSSG